MTSTIYLLFNGEPNVCWSFDRAALERALVEQPDCYLLPHVKELTLEDSLAQALREREGPEHLLRNPHVAFSRVPEHHFESTRQFIAHPPEWSKAEGLRVFVIFKTDGSAYWSPSGNNLNSISERAPSRYLGNALRVDLTPDEYVRIDGYFDWVTDNF